MTHLTGDPKYRAAADAIYNHVSQYTEMKNGKASAFWNVMTGKPATARASLGFGSDSFYEYLFKAPLVDDCANDFALSKHCAVDDETNQRMLRQYQSLLVSLDYRNVSGTLYPVEDGRTFHHLLCFLPGLLALTGNDHIPLAHQLAMGCYSTYHETSTGLGPKQLKLGVRGKHTVSDPAYLLRPEFVESLFVLWRRTGNVVYQDMAWSIFTRLQEHCRVEHGYAGIRNVMRNDGGGYVDDMPSYFIAETLKYLLLLFGPDDYVSFDDFVFTTEGHPLLK
jgi:mannosyl-oligosaccharide alpha-1,2-mannosidase